MRWMTVTNTSHRSSWGQRRGHSRRCTGLCADGRVIRASPARRGETWQHSPVVGHPEGVAFVRVLGPVQVVTSSGAVVDLPSVSQRRLLAVLALHARTSVRAEWLAETVGVSPGELRTTVS